jgi:DNA-binding CsgD family transcriptional regulator
VTEAAAADGNDLLLQLYRLSHEMPIEEFQNAALSLVKPMLPFDSALWATATVTQRGVDMHTMHLHRSSREMLEAFEPVKHLDTATAAVTGQPRVTIGLSADHSYAGREKRSIRDFLKRFGHENFFVTAQTDPHTGLLHWISLYRADAERPCRPEELRILEQLAPHVMQALAMNRRMHLSRMETPGASSKRGWAIADLRGVTYHADPQFAALLRREYEAWDGGFLPRPMLQAFLQGQARFIGRRVVAQHHVEQRLLFVKARPTCAADRLTPREGAIAQRVAKGMTHKEIAQLLDRSPATVRNQIQAIYGKLEIGSVGELAEALRLLE